MFSKQTAVTHNSLHLSIARALVLVNGICLLMGLAYFWQATVDDAFISARYAQNIARGFGPVFNLGERVEGFSNPLWVLFLAIIEYLQGDPIWSSKILGSASAFFCMGLLLLAWRRLKLDLNTAGFALFLFVLQPGLWLWSLAGLETTTYTFLITTIALLTTFEIDDPNKFAWSAALTAIAATLRPEGLMFFGVSLFSKTIFLFANKKLVLQKVVWSLTVFAVLFSPYMIFRYLYYGALLPNTYFAKPGGIARISSGLDYLGGLLSNPMTIALLILAAIGLWLYLKDSCRSPLIFVATLCVIAQFLFTLWAGGDWMPLGRFMVPVLPVLVILAGVGISTGIDYLQRRLKSNTITTMSVVLLILLLALQTIRILDDYRQYYWRFANGLTSRSMLGTWMAKNLSKDFTIAYGDAGVLAYTSKLPFLDMNGLTDLEIGRIRYSGLSLQERELAEAHYILARHPDMIIVVTRDNPSSNWQPSDYGDGLVADAEFARKYYYIDYLIAYPPNIVPHYPYGRYLLIYLARGVTIPGLNAFLECANRFTMSPTLLAGC